MILSPFVLAEGYDTRDILTLDERHFRAIRGPDYSQRARNPWPSVAGLVLNQRFGLPRLWLLRYRVSRLGLVGLSVAQLAFLGGADAFDTS